MNEKLPKEKLPAPPLQFYRDFEKRNSIEKSVYDTYDIKRGLRNSDGTGVVVGATKISNVHGYVIADGDKIPDEGKLTFRGHDIADLIAGFTRDDRFGFEEVAYLLMFGKLPNGVETAKLRRIIDENRELPNGFTADFIMEHPSANIMNMMQRAINVLYSFDSDAEEANAEHEIAVALSLISRLPRIMVLAYHADRAAFHGESFVMHRSVTGYSTAETILSMLKPDRSFTHEDAMMLDVMLMLHAEHGGGNNSTFTCRCLTSSGTDPYSAYAGAMGSLKGNRHGGANIKVLQMQADMKEHIKDWTNEGEIADYLRKIVAKEAFDKTGLVYGMGHAVYTLSDPRAVICKEHATKLAAGTEFEKELEFLKTIERLAPEIIGEAKGDAKKICANIDMYSGFVYKMLGIPEEMLTPLFACSRMAGWAAHRFEELTSGKRIMRPAYQVVQQPQRGLPKLFSGKSAERKAAKEGAAGAEKTRKSATKKPAKAASTGTRKSAKKSTTK